MNLFEAVKASVTTRQAAELYGIDVNRFGKACCIFHDDRHPSMKVDERFHCFSCGADGDVIDFTARLFGMDLREAALKLAADFGIQYGPVFSSEEYSGQKSKVRRSLLQQVKICQDENYRALCAYYHLLCQWDKQYAPGPEDEEWHPRFVEANRNTARVEYLLDELRNCSPDEAQRLIALNKNEIGRFANRVREVRTENRRASHELSR